MRIKRRSFLKSSLAAGAGMAAPNFITRLATATDTGSKILPWQREMPLREAAQSVALESTLNRQNPLPEGGFGVGGSMAINNLKMRTTIWGPPDRITISLNKNNVWDRRLNIRSLTAPTLTEIIDGACSPANRDYVGRQKDSQRPESYGYLLKEGGTYDGYRYPVEYPFPCMKPVGQIILGMDAFADAAAPKITQNCASGLVKLSMTKGSAHADLEYVLGMTSNLYAVRGTFAGIDAPISLRLYRHQDTSHLLYMKPDNQSYINPDAAVDKDFNFPMDPPTSGEDGQYFWIHQKLPPEKTFPEGFECVLMGVVTTPAAVKMESVEGQAGLGTPPPDKRIAAATGAAATVTFTPGADGKFEALVTVVTTMDSADVMTEAKKHLAKAGAAGFDGVIGENAGWWSAFYDKRENGRIFHGEAGRDCTDNIRTIYRSYTDSHGGGTKTDMRHLECSASYGLPERDIQPWTSAPCYNEVFTTSRFVRNWGDSEDMWKQLVWHWMEAGKQNAADMFGLPGMLVVHGYLPPVKPDVYVHTTITLEFCLGTMAEIIKPSWDEWDYGGDINVLRNECYPLMREMAIFYAAYAKKGDDGYYHVIPSMEEERWGWYPNLARNKDVTSSLCMFRWALTHAAEAAELLGVDADLRKNWREVAVKIVPYPTWQTPDGLEYAGQPGLQPSRLPGDHFGEPSMYPALLADEINLDSPEEQKEMMLRTVHALRTAGTAAETALLLGVPPDPSIRGMRLTGREEDAEALLNSRGGRIHLFPVTPATDTVAFHNFQARGGFLVSACKEANGVTHVEIEARRNHLCSLMNLWPGKRVIVREAGQSTPAPVHLDASNGECLIFSALAGRRYLISPATNAD